MCPAPGNRSAGFNISNVVAHEVAMRQAIHIHDDERIKSADQNGPIGHPRLAKAVLILCDVLNSTSKTWRPFCQDRRVMLIGSVIGEHQFEIKKALYRECR